MKSDAILLARDAQDPKQTKQRRSTMLIVCQTSRRGASGATGYEKHALAQDGHHRELSRG